jgi:hypothetical protein
MGVAGEMEHGGACVHPMLGKPMRAAIGGGKAVIGSNVKVAAQKTRAMDRMTAPLRKQTADRRTARDHGGSNPLCSSGESGANHAPSQFYDT